MVVGPGEGKGCTSTHPCCGAAQVDNSIDWTLDCHLTGTGPGLQGGLQKVSTTLGQPCLPGGGGGDADEGEFDDDGGDWWLWW